MSAKSAVSKTKPTCVNKRILKEHTPTLLEFFSKLLGFWFHKNSHILLIIVLKFHAFIPCRSEENIKKRAYFIDYGGNHHIKL